MFCEFVSSVLSVSMSIASPPDDASSVDRCTPGFSTLLLLVPVVICEG